MKSDPRSSAEKWLDSFEPTQSPMKDGSHLRAIGDALTAVENAGDALERAVAEAHDAGDSWEAISVVLGTSRQAAHRKFAHRVAAAHVRRTRNPAQPE
ncbi:hypothetical protein [Subtercola lobariae]|uniref:Uncharacterized protein n=1 Tax=Subtercola lobariae TaxID=1588641 RepID=A0A917B7D8_9MICO|nr:hypothetical protein [Subtercola lobariae]GGF26272.1 hypothetical protein GCM10011399_19620 [Subtercola lobariae]